VTSKKTIHEQSFGRRSMIKVGAGAAAALAIPSVAHGQDASPSASPGASPAAAAEGYYPSPAPGVFPAYTKMPAIFKSTDGVPGAGGEVKTMIMIYGAPVEGKEGNQYWAGLEERLGVTWTPIQVPNASYGEKAAALLASGDMPDLFYLNFNQTLTPLQKFVVEGAFVDLTEYLTGDNLKKYPNLAAYPAYTWEATKTNVKIYGVPCPGGQSGQIPAFRQDWADKLSGGTPTNADEFHELLVAMAKNDPDGNGQEDTWGLARYESNWDMGIFYPMFRVPNGWRFEDDGSFTNRIETEEFKLALEFMARVFKDGGFHPDSAAMQYEEAVNLFRTGRTGVHADGSAIHGKGGFLEDIRKYQADANVTRLLPFGHDGGEGVTYNLPGIFGFTAIPIQHEGNDEKIDELFRILNWLAAPFGSEEWLYKNYGLEGTHFEYNDFGFPERNELGNTEEGALTAYIAGSPGVHVNPTEPELARIFQEEQELILSIGIDNPAANLFSETAIKESGTLGQLVADTIASVVQGREGIEAVDTLVSDWKSRGGDTIRQEYEEAYAASQG
jgi:putative aldouronate transport system substrate-binding protein